MGAHARPKDLYNQILIYIYINILLTFGPHNVYVVVAEIVYSLMYIPLEGLQVQLEYAIKVIVVSRF